MRWGATDSARCVFVVYNESKIFEADHLLNSLAMDGDGAVIEFIVIE